jgi:hypothetical protein
MTTSRAALSALRQNVAVEKVGLKPEEERALKALRYSRPLQELPNSDAVMMARTMRSHGHETEAISQMACNCCFRRESGATVGGAESRPPNAA